jgi:hypothetical protein
MVFTRTEEVMMEILNWFATTDRKDWPSEQSQGLVLQKLKSLTDHFNTHVHFQKNPITGPTLTNIFDDIIHAGATLNAGGLLSCKSHLKMTESKMADPAEFVSEATPVVTLIYKEQVRTKPKAGKSREDSIPKAGRKVIQ